jgi:multidrug efflux pump subunit AcrB
MMIAIVSVTVLIRFTLGHRESGVVALAIPVTLALTLAVFYLYGYTLNRITLFALIFSIGILVDDAIVVVENVVGHMRLESNRDRSKFEVAIEAVDEVGNPTILATLTVIAAILPMAFVGGLMGPYMRPIPLIGILPAHWLMGAFFTATSMIGFIAGAGIVVRNSIILVDFIELRLQQGMPLDQAVIDAGAVRFRPMMLTAAAVVVGASVILFDPIFSGTCHIADGRRVGISAVFADDGANSLFYG